LVATRTVVTAMPDEVERAVGSATSRPTRVSAEVALRHDSSLAVHPGRLREVVVGLAILLLTDDECHI
jgi:hypothetical protein